MLKWSFVWPKTNITTVGTAKEDLVEPDGSNHDIQYLIPMTLPTRFQCRGSASRRLLKRCLSKNPSEAECKNAYEAQ